MGEIAAKSYRARESAAEQRLGDEQASRLVRGTRA